MPTTNRQHKGMNFVGIGGSPDAGEPPMIPGKEMVVAVRNSCGEIEGNRRVAANMRANCRMIDHVVHPVRVKGPLTHRCGLIGGERQWTEALNGSATSEPS